MIGKFSIFSKKILLKKRKNGNFVLKSGYITGVGTSDNAKLINGF